MVIMSQAMSLEEYKRKVEDFLVKKNNFTIQEARRLIQIYSDDFPEFIKDDWSPSGAGSAMMLGY